MLTVPEDLAYNGRLVHAAAFTYAEPGYPELTNTHVMRVGSVSKAVDTGMGVFSYGSPTEPESPPETVQHNGAVPGGIALVMRRRFAAPVAAGPGNSGTDPPMNSVVIALAFNAIRADNEAIHYFLEGDVLFERAKADAAVNGWPNWTLFKEVELPEFSA